MAQVLLPNARTRESGSEAILRALQAYQAFTGARENSAKTDAMQQAQENEDNGVLDTPTKARLAAMGATVSNDPVPGAFQFAERDDESDSGFSPVYIKPPLNKSELMTPEDKALKDLQIQKLQKDVDSTKTPKTVAYTDPQGQVRIGAVDPDTGLPVHKATNPLAPKQETDKTDVNNDKALKDVTTALEAMRGNPAVQQAEKDVYAAGKVKSLIDQYGGDLNKLNPQAAQLLVQEVGKIASGGAPSQHELDSLTPGVLNSTRFASIVQKFTGDPSPANAGEFLKEYQTYAEGLSKDAQKVITERYGRILDAQKRRLSGDDYDNLKDLYVNRFKDAVQEGLGGKNASNGNNASGGSGTAFAAPGGKPKTVIQNGNTYILNEKTGEYE